jgi:hypothetical protein
MKKLHEEFKLYENMWESNDGPKTSSLEVILGTYKGNKIVDLKGVSHIEAYKELVKTLKTLSDKDMYDLFIYWVADKMPGDKDADVILIVDAATTLIDEMGEDPDDSGNGYEGGVANPANRLVLPYTYSPEDLGLPRYAYDFVEGLLDVNPGDVNQVDENNKANELTEATGSGTIRCMFALYEDDDGYVCKVGVYAGDLSVEEMEDLLTEQGMSFVTCWDEYEETTSNTYNLGDVVEVFDVEDEDIEDVAALAGKDPEEYKNVGFF